MFVLAPSPTFRAKVKFGLLAADGSTQPVEFTAVYHRLTVDQAQAMADEATANGWGDRDMARRLLAGWGDDLQDAHGAPLAYTPDNVAALLNVPHAARAILETFHRSQRDAALGN
jgi:hypothetical protein